MDTLIWICLNAIGCAALLIIGCGKKKKPDSQIGTPTPVPAATSVPTPSAVAAPDAQVPARESSAEDTQKTEDAKSKLAKTEDGDKKDQLKPNKAKLNEKEKLIAKGQVRNKADYPTMDDIKSDWTDKKTNTNEEVGATQDENEENGEGKKEKKEFKEPEQVKKADAKDPAYETRGVLDQDIFKK